ncbi:MAG: multicopper oxidase domain-containing protein [Geobacteraceae bacterium]
MRRKFLAYLILLAASTFSFSGCGNDTTKVVVEGSSNAVLLNPVDMAQFVSPLPAIPTAVPDTTTIPGSDYYTVIVEQTSGYDFGLRKKDGSEFTNPATGAPIRTTVWGYTTNGIKAGYLGATIDSHSTLDASGKPVVVKYINDLKDAAGHLLTKHLLTVDPTLHGANMGEPEVRIVTHLHGAHVDAPSDGHPEAWITNDPNAKTGLPYDPVSGRAARPDGNTVTYTYRNDQLAEQLWYHDHAMGITRLNVYAGLAANYLLRDDYENGLNLPKGAYEMPLVIQDKSFNEDGSLHYDSNRLLAPNGDIELDANGNPIMTSKPEFFGNVITVNGKAWPYLDVEPRKYRFRILNGSDSRFYNMWLQASDASGIPIAIPDGAIIQIGNDGGLLPTAVRNIGNDEDNGLLLALAERADVVIDFSKFPSGARITVRNDAPTPYPSGDPVDSNATTSKVMQFRVNKVLAGTDTSVVPDNPRPISPLGAPALTRYVDLQEGTDSYLLFDPSTGTTSERLKILLNGLNFDAPVTETPVVNTVEDWVIINNTVDMHPMHLHLVDFEVIEKGSIAPGTYTPADGLGAMPTVATGGLRPNAEPGLDPVIDSAPSDSAYRVQPQEMGQKDTVRVPPANEEIGSQGYVRIRAKFDIIGTYMWHCHILAHEDHEMMRPFRVIAAP